ncbi:MAG: hypothetical protein OXE41_01640 [Gammaproteobacteria bacterium]|nr:hypothetical protein [Gammaproteobacteria bacterium]
MGRGIEHIFEACRQARAPEPVIQTESQMGIKFVFSEDHMATVQNGRNEKDMTKVAQETTQEKILALL